jgi:hypothetical protein
MYYRIKRNNLTLERLKKDLSATLKSDCKLYFKKGSKFKLLQFIGRKDSLIIRRNALHGYRLYLVFAKNYCEISILEYIPSGFIRNNPIPMGVLNILIHLFYRIDSKEFYDDLLNSLDKNYDGKIQDS